VSGPTGCGKSSTLAALIQEINLTDSRHIVTIESPIEYYFLPADQKIAFSIRSTGIANCFEVINELSPAGKAKTCWRSCLILFVFVYHSNRRRTGTSRIPPRINCRRCSTPSR
jgi:hypothetical protein